LAAPRVLAPGLVSDHQTAAKFVVSWGASNNPAGTTYDVQWSTDGGAVSALTGTTAATTATVFGHPGHTYRFRVRVVEPGGASAYSAWSSATVPLDQSSAKFSSGWHTVHGTSYWLGSTASTGHNGAALTLSTTARQLQILGDTMPGGASFRVYLGSKYVRTVSTAASAVHHRVVLWRSSVTGLASRSLRLVVVVPKGATRTLHIDGFVAAR
jgi:hypothetical protein